MTRQPAETTPDPHSKWRMNLFRLAALCFVVTAVGQAYLTFCGPLKAIEIAMVVLKVVGVGLFVLGFARARWRVQLSTALVMMLAAGVLLGLNVPLHHSTILFEDTVRGWPLPYYVSAKAEGIPRPERWLFGVLYLDTIVNLVFVCGMGYVFQRFIARRKTAES